jgi:uncharacterized BrkB/YihY/UPF0761 family membrane protein
MLSEKEKQFITYWESVRDKQNTVSGKIMNGLPMAIIFSLPILLIIFVIYFFFPDWYTKISNTSTGSFVTVVIAVIGCILFFSYFRMHYKWEMNEQAYQELKIKRNKIDKPAETA